MKKGAAFFVLALLLLLTAGGLWAEEAAPRPRAGHARATPWRPRRLPSGRGSP